MLNVCLIILNYEFKQANSWVKGLTLNNEGGNSVHGVFVVGCSADVRAYVTLLHIFHVQATLTSY